MDRRSEPQSGEVPILEGHDDVRRPDEAEARRYAIAVLGLPPSEATDDLVAASLARARRTPPRREADPGAVENLQEAVRHELWRRQRHPARVARQHREIRNAIVRPKPRKARRRPHEIAIDLAVVMVVLAAAFGIWVAVDAHRSNGAPVAEVASVVGTVVAPVGSGDSGPDLGSLPVSIIDDTDQAVATGRTDDDGGFRFAQLPPGAYRVIIERPGSGDAADQPVTSEVFLESGAEVRVTIVLESS